MTGREEGRLPEVGTSVQERRAWIAQMRPVWLDVVRPFDLELEEVFPDAAVVPPSRLANCRVVPSREVLVREHLPHGGVVAEVGTLTGEFARFIVEAAGPRELHVVDKRLDRFERAPLASAIAAGQVVLHEGDSATLLATFPDSYFDWIYIDADHRYAGVRRDADAAKRKVKPDGLLVFNDYIFWSHLELWQYGVVHVVNELLAEEDWEMVYFALQPQMYCDVALRRVRP
jgi:hypothetical protein